MEFLKTASLGLILPILVVFLAFSGLSIAMEIVQGNVYPKDSWIGIPMNGGKSVSISAYTKKPITLWTDGLKGCVVTIIKLEHYTGEQTIAMCHFAHYSKNQNFEYIKNFVDSCEINTIKKATCIIIPPGIIKERGIKPILDKEWEHIIIEPLGNAIPGILFEVTPYLFNTRSSSVKYTANAAQTKTTIFNLSPECDEKNKDLLFECHNQNIRYDYKRLLAPIVAITALAGFFLYHTS